MNQTAANSDELNTLKEDFLASMNHEIRTPLSGVLGMVDLLLETTLTAEQKEYLEDARLCAENLLAILNSTLEYSALSADQVSLEEADFSLRAMLNTLLADFDFKAKAKGLGLTAHFARDVPEVAFGDALRLQQVLTHIMANAVKFTSKGGVAVEVCTTEVDECGLVLRITICDTGIGIAEHNLNHIFDSFRQLETGLARGYTGMGLGLAVTRKLIALLNGNVAVDSRLGQGTQFRIGIPLKNAREPALPLRIAGETDRIETETIKKETIKTDPIRILVVENDGVAQTLIAHYQKRVVYRVDSASTGSGALEAARKDQYSLILIDLLMPDMDGLETALRLRKLPGYARVPIVALTASYSQNYRELCLEHGLQGFLARPIEASELIGTVEKLLAPSKGPAVEAQRIRRIAV